MIMHEQVFLTQVIDKVVFKAAMQKTVEKVMGSHMNDSNARFLIKEGSRIHKLLMLYVEKLSPPS